MDLLNINVFEILVGHFFLSRLLLQFIVILWGIKEPSRPGLGLRFGLVRLKLGSGSDAKCST